MATQAEQRRSDMKRGKYAVSVDPDSVKRIDALVLQGMFRSRSHGFDEALRRLLSDIDDSSNEAEPVDA